MTKALAKKPKPVPAEPVPMTADEAIDALATMNRYVIDWSRSLLEFAQRRGWEPLGFVSLKECLSAKLRIGAETAMCVLRAAQVREELAGLAKDRRLQERIWAMPDSHTIVLTRLEEPKKRLAAVRQSVGHNGSQRVTAKSLSLTVNRLIGKSALAPVVRRARRERCPSCNGTGYVAPAT